MKIEIVNDDYRTFNSKAGKPLAMQKAYLHKDGEKYPTEFEFFVEIDKQTGAVKTHQAGMYQLAKDAVYIDRNGNLSVSPRLEPLGAK